MRTSLMLSVVIVAVCARGDLALAQPRDESHRALAGEPAWQAGYAEADITPAEGTGHDGRLRPGAPSARSARPAARPGAGATRPRRQDGAVDRGRRAGLWPRVRSMRCGTRSRPPTTSRRQRSAFLLRIRNWGPAINYRTNFNIGSVNVWYLARLEQTLLELVDEALEDLSPATVSYGACEVQIGMCRRKPNDKGPVWMGPVSAGQLRRAHTGAASQSAHVAPGKSCWSGMPATPPSTGLIGKWSPDYPGTMRRTLEAELDDCRALFAMGCGGDAKVVYHDPGEQPIRIRRQPGTERSRRCEAGRRGAGLSRKRRAQ